MSAVEHVRRLSRRMRWVVGLGGCVIGLGGAAWLASSVFAPEAFHAAIECAFGGGPVLTFTPLSTAVVVGMLAAQLAILLAAIWCVWRMFGVFGEEEPVAATAAIWMYRGSVGFLAAALASILATPAIVLALTLGNPPGSRSFTLAIGSAELFALLVAAVMYMTARVLALAAEIRDDHRAII